MNRADDIDSLALQLAGELVDEVRKFPPERYIKYLLEPIVGHYGMHGPEFDRTIVSLSELGGPELIGKYHKLVFASLLSVVPSLPTRALLPSSVATLLEKELARISAELLSQPVTWYIPENDLFQRDLAMCTLRLLPCGVLYTDVADAVPHAWIFGQKLQDIPATFLFLMRSTRGLQPMYQIHMDDRTLEDWSEEGWIRSYVRIGDLMVRNENIKGVFGSSWFLDPRVSEVSPRLAFIYRIPKENGARFLRVGKDTTGLALKKSPTRRKLYFEGQYTPYTYAFVWGRRDFLNWYRGKQRIRSD